MLGRLGDALTHQPGSDVPEPSVRYGGGRTDWLPALCVAVPYGMMGPMPEVARIPKYRVTVGEGSDHTVELEVLHHEDGPAARLFATQVGKTYAHDHGMGDVPIQVELISERDAN